MLLLIIKYIILAILFILIGNLLRNKIRWYDKAYGNSFWFAADFFIGYTVFFSVIRSMDIVTHSFRYTSGISFLIAFVFCATNYKKISFSFKELTRLMLVLVSLFIVLLVFVVLYWTQNDLTAGSYGLIGSLHSPRYFNIMHFVLKEDTIPVLGQNYAQTVIAALPLLFGKTLSLLSLSILLALVLAFASFLVFGFFKKFSSFKWFHIIATVLVLCSATTIGLQYFLFVDSGWPLFINGYSDSIVGVATFLLVFLLLARYVRNNNGLSKTWVYVYIFLTLLLWMASAIQNLFFLVLLAFVFIINKWKTDKKSIGAHFGVLLLLVAFSTVIGVFGGSMITPASFQKNKEKIPGMMNIREKKKPLLQLQPGFIYLKYDGAEISDTMIGSAKWVFRENNTRMGSSKYGKFFFATGVRVLIFPFLIICFIGWYLRVRKDDEELRQLWHVTILLLGTGYILIFPVAILGYKSELSRFLMPGLFFFSLLLCFGMYRIIEGQSSLSKKIFVPLIALLLLLGPVLGTVDVIKTNISLKNFTKNVSNLYEPLNDYVR